jgi:hypothetical protein
LDGYWKREGEEEDDDEKEKDCLILCDDDVCYECEEIGVRISESHKTNSKIENLFIITIINNNNIMHRIRNVTREIIIRQETKTILSQRFERR